MKDTSLLTTPKTQIKLPTVHDLQGYHPHVASFRTRRRRVLSTVLASIGCSAVISLTTLVLAKPLHDEEVRAVYQTARQSALKEFQSTLPGTLLKEKDVVNSVCNAWWFGLTVKDRKITNNLNK